MHTGRKWDSRAPRCQCNALRCTALRCELLGESRARVCLSPPPPLTGASAAVHFAVVRLALYVAGTPHGWTQGGGKRKANARRRENEVRVKTKE